MKLVKGEGPQTAKIIFIGEAPGKEEEKYGRPFVGRAGKLLNEVLGSIGLQRSEVYITNVVQVRPTTKDGDNRKPTPYEVKKYFPYLQHELGKMKPKLVVLLGDTSVKALLGAGHPISACHGRIIEQGGKRYLITYHPAAALRFPKLKNILRKDFLKVRQFLK